MAGYVNAIYNVVGFAWDVPVRLGRHTSGIRLTNASGFDWIEVSL
jgi:hypothetical protein